MTFNVFYVWADQMVQCEEHCTLRSLEDLGSYTKAFDAKYGTDLYKAMVRNGFPGAP